MEVGRLDNYGCSVLRCCQYVLHYAQNSNRLGYKAEILICTETYVTISQTVRCHNNNINLDSFTQSRQVQSEPLSRSSLLVQ